METSKRTPRRWPRATAALSTLVLALGVGLALPAFGLDGDGQSTDGTGATASVQSEAVVDIAFTPDCTGFTATSDHDISFVEVDGLKTEGVNSPTFSDAAGGAVIGTVTVKSGTSVVTESCTAASGGAGAEVATAGGTTTTTTTTTIAAESTTSGEGETVGGETEAALEAESTVSGETEAAPEAETLVRPAEASESAAPISPSVMGKTVTREAEVAPAATGAPAPVPAAVEAQSAAASPAPPSMAPASAAAAEQPPRALAFTGSSSAILALLGFLLVAVGLIARFIVQPLVARATKS